MNASSKRSKAGCFSALFKATCLSALFVISTPAVAAQQTPNVTRAKPATDKHKIAAAKPAQRQTGKRKKPVVAKVVTGKAFGNSSAVRQLAREIAQKHALPTPWVQQQIAGARQLPQILPLVMPPVTPQVKNWHAYRARFLTECRIQTGVRFWREHTLQLDRAFTQTGVEPRYIVGILGVETFYGQHQGQYKLIDALSTLGFLKDSARLKLMGIPWLATPGGGTLPSFTGMKIRVLAQGEPGLCGAPLSFTYDGLLMAGASGSAQQKWTLVPTDSIEPPTPAQAASFSALTALPSQAGTCGGTGMSEFSFACPSCELLDAASFAFTMHYSCQALVVEALAAGRFADVKRRRDGGRGRAGVVVRAADYFNPIEAGLRAELQLDANEASHGNHR